MGGRVIEIPRSDAMLAALDRIVEVAAAETDDNEAFEEPIRDFWDVFFADCDARDLCHKWTPFAVLLFLEDCLIADESLPVDDRINYAAVVSVLRDLLIWAGQEQARLN